MKFKTTEKAMKEGCFCQSVPYCCLQDLLSVTDPIAYTCGVYGWNANIYTNGNLAIVTGYRSFGKNYIAKNELVQFNSKARKIDSNEKLSYYEKKRKKEVLLNKFWQLFRSRVMEGIER